MNKTKNEQIAQIIFSKNVDEFQKLLNDGLNVDEVLFKIKFLFTKEAYIGSLFAEDFSISEKYYSFEGYKENVNFKELSEELSDEFFWPLLFYAIFLDVDLEILSLIMKHSKNLDYKDKNKITLKQILRIKNKVSYYQIYYQYVKSDLKKFLTFKASFGGDIKLLSNNSIKTTNITYDSNFGKVSNDKDLIDIYQEKIHISLKQINGKWDHFNFKNLETNEEMIIPLTNKPVTINKYDKIIQGKLYYHIDEHKLRKTSLFYYDIELNEFFSTPITFLSDSLNYSIMFKDNDIYSWSFKDGKTQFQAIQNGIHQSNTFNMDIPYPISIIFQNMFVLWSESTFYFIETKNLKLVKTFPSFMKTIFAIENIDNEFFITGNDIGIHIWKFIKLKNGDFDVKLFNTVKLNNIVYNIKNIRYCPVSSNIYIVDGNQTIVYFLKLNLWNWNFKKEGDIRFKYE